MSVTVLVSATVTEGTTNPGCTLPSLSYETFVVVLRPDTSCLSDCFEFTLTVFAAWRVDLSSTEGVEKYLRVKILN